MKPVKEMTKKEQLEHLKNEYFVALMSTERDVRIHSRKARMPKVVYKILLQTRDFQVVEYKRNKYPTDFSIKQ